MQLLLRSLLLVLALPVSILGQDTSLRRQTQEERMVSPVLESNHIIGGVNAGDGEYPFYVKFEGGVLCGGSLLSPNRVLTAGHCIRDYGWPDSVRVGATTTSNGEVVKVQCGIVHPDYLSPYVTVLGDVAVLKLETDVTSVTEFVELNRDPDYPSVAGSDLTVIGFGKVANNGGTSDTLRKVGTFYVPYETCLAGYNNGVIRQGAHLCGDVPNKGDCNGGKKVMTRKSP